MSSAIRLDYREPPQQWLQYLRALRTKKTKRGCPDMPPLNAFLTNQRINRKYVQRYAQVCGFDRSLTYLPISYPHLLAFPLHMELMLHPAFPLNAIGLVHVRNRIQQHRPIRLDEHLDIHCYLSACEPTSRGIEFTLHTNISSAGDILWQASSVMLARQPHVTAPIKRTPNTNPKGELRPFEHIERWSLATDLGRRYARISGDSNPIHLFALSAKLFGFKRHIAHGMWSKARVAAALCPNAKSATIDIAFKQPIFLPSKIELHHQHNNECQTEFEIRALDQLKIHANGTITIHD